MKLLKLLKKVNQKLLDLKRQPRLWGVLDVELVVAALVMWEASVYRFQETLLIKEVDYEVCL